MKYHHTGKRKLNRQDAKDAKTKNLNRRDAEDAETKQRAVIFRAVIHENKIPPQGMKIG
jgi:hypothetical protein